jgi:hypothetical protein
MERPRGELLQLVGPIRHARYGGVHRKLLLALFSLQGSIRIVTTPHPQSNRHLTGAVAGSLIAMGSRATVGPGTTPLIVSMLLGSL